MSIYLSMMTFALVGAISPGPVNVIAASSGARAGYRKTTPYVFGASVSYTLVVVISGVSLEQVALVVPQITWFLKISGAMFLLFMAYKIAMSKGFASAQDGDDVSLPGFWEGALVQVLNPKAWLVAMSGVSLFTLGRNPAMMYLINFSIISFVLCFVGVSVWGAMGSYVRQFLATPKRQIGFNYTMGTLLSVTVLYMLAG